MLRINLTAFSSHRQPLFNRPDAGDKATDDPNFVAKFSRDDRLTIRAKDIDMHMMSFGANHHYLMRFINENNFSVSRTGKLDEWGVTRVFFLNDTVVVVYSDGRVDMQPKNHVNGLIGEIAREVQKDLSESDINLQKELGKKIVKDSLKKMSELLGELKQ